MRAVSSSMSGMPLATWPWPFPLPMSCSSMPSIRRSGRATSLSTSAMPSASADWPGRQRLQVLHREQRVLVGGEPVVDVVLHEAGERAPLRQIAAQHAQLVHAPAASARCGPSCGRWRGRGRAPRASAGSVSSTRSSDSSMRPLHVDAEIEAEPVRVPEHLHEPRGVLAEGAAVRVHQVQRAVQHEEPVGERLLAEAALHRAWARERLPAAGDEAPGHAVDHARVEIVVAHELLDGQRHVVAHVAEVLRDLRLDVAREHVVLVAGEEVQLVAHAPEEGQRGVRRTPARGR